MADQHIVPGLKNRLGRAAHAFDAAPTDNIVERCRQYLAPLAEQFAVSMR